MRKSRFEWKQPIRRVEFSLIPLDLIDDRSADDSVFESVATSGWLNGTQSNPRATQITSTRLLTFA